MTVAISNGIFVLLLYLQSTHAQQGVNIAGPSQQKATCNTATGIHFNSPQQPGQQINWQQTSNIQQAPVSQQTQNFQQPGMNSQAKQQNQNPVSDILSALQNLRFTTTQKQEINPMPTSSCGYKQNFEQNQPGSISQISPNNNFASPAQDPTKPSFTFQFVPVSQYQAPEQNQVMNTVPVQFLASGTSQTASQQGPSYYVQNQPNTITGQQVQSSQTNSGQSNPIVFTLNPQQPQGQSHSIVYAPQPAQQSSRGNQQKPSKPTQGSNIEFDNPLSLLMSQLQSPSGNPDIASILPLLMSSKQEKSSGMKVLLPLILSLLNDNNKNCGCPNCGCPFNNNNAKPITPTINGGYSNLMNYGQQDFADSIKTAPSSKIVAKVVNESDESEDIEVKNETKKQKVNVITDVSDEPSDEDDDYEDYDD